MEKDETRFTMRIDNKLWEKIKILAQKSRRSAVKEIEYIFDLLFGNSDLEDLTDDMNELENLIKQAKVIKQNSKTNKQNEKSA